MTRAPDATGATGAVIDIDIFRSSRSVALATVSPAIAAELASDARQPALPLPRLTAGDKIVDTASGEVGMVLKTPEDPRSRIIAGFQFGRRALFRSQLELWDGREDEVAEDVRGRRANPADYPPCDVEPEPEAMP
jgi:hypothetical protein